MLLRKLEAKGIRGISGRTVEVTFQKQATVLLGLNGSGKSSIADAIEVLFSRGGKVSYMGENATNNQPGWRAACNLGCESAEVYAAVEGVEGVLRRRLGETLSGDLASVVDRQKFPKCVIRGLRARSDVLDVSDLDRGKWIDDALGLGEASSIRANLQALVREWKSRCSQLEGQTQRKQDEFVRRYAIAADEKEAVAHANRQLAALGDVQEPLSLASEWPDRYVLIRDACQDGIGEALALGEEHLHNADKLSSIIKRLATLGLGASVGAYRTAALDYSRVIEGRDPVVVAVTKLLEEARDLLHQHAELEQCPLCEQDIAERWSSAAGLLNRIDERLAASSDITGAADALRDAKAKLVMALSRARDTFVENAQLGSALTCGAVDKIVAELNGVIEDVSLAETEQYGAHLNNLISCAAVSIWSEEVRQRVEADSAYERIARPNQIMQSADVIEQLFADLSAIQRNKTDLGVARSVQDDLESFQRVFGEVVARKRTEIVLTLADDICSFCRAVVASSGAAAKTDEFRTVLLQQAANDDRALQLRIGFYGYDDRMPQAVLSDSRQHLLSLAISVCLLAKFNKEFPLIVLDDVLTSLDPEHRLGLADALPRWLDKFQIVVLTNDDKFASALRDKGFDVQRIYKWTLDDGPLLETQIGSEDRLDDAFNKEDVELAAALLRPEMEHWLRACCEQWYGRVCMKAHGDWTLKEYWDGLVKSTKDTLKQLPEASARWTIAGAQGLQDEVSGLIGTGNWATHPSGSVATCLGMSGMRACWEAFKSYRDIYRCACGDWFRRVGYAADDGVYCPGKKCERRWMDRWQSAPPPDASA